MIKCWLSGSLRELKSKGKTMVIKILVLRKLLTLFGLWNCKVNFTGSSQGEASYSELQTMQRPPNTIPQSPPGIKITALEWIFFLLSFGIFSNKLLITCTDVFLCITCLTYYFVISLSIGSHYGDVNVELPPVYRRHNFIPPSPSRLPPSPPRPGKWIQSCK